MTALAQCQACAERCWWRQVLAHGPKLEIYGYFEGLPVRRLLLEKTRCHVYYLVIEPEDLVRIVAIWGAARGVEPRLG